MSAEKRTRSKSRQRQPASLEALHSQVTTSMDSIQEAIIDVASRFSEIQSADFYLLEDAWLRLTAIKKHVDFSTLSESQCKDVAEQLNTTSKDKDFSEPLIQLRNLAILVDDVESLFVRIEKKLAAIIANGVCVYCVSLSELTSVRLDDVVEYDQFLGKQRKGVVRQLNQLKRQGLTWKNYNQDMNATVKNFEMVGGMLDKTRLLWEEFQSTVTEWIELDRSYPEKLNKHIAEAKQNIRRLQEETELAGDVERQYFDEKKHRGMRIEKFKKRRSQIRGKLSRAKRAHKYCSERLAGLEPEPNEKGCCVAKEEDEGISSQCDRAEGESFTREATNTPDETSRQDCNSNEQATSEKSDEGIGSTREHEEALSKTGKRVKSKTGTTSHAKSKDKCKAEKNVGRAQKESADSKSLDTRQDDEESKEAEKSVEKSKKKGKRGKKNEQNFEPEEEYLVANEDELNVNNKTSKKRNRSIKDDLEIEHFQETSEDSNANSIAKDVKCNAEEDVSDDADINADKTSVSEDNCAPIQTSQAQTDPNRSQRKGEGHDEATKTSAKSSSLPVPSQQRRRQHLMAYETELYKRRMQNLEREQSELRDALQKVEKKMKELEEEENGASQEISAERRRKEILKQIRMLEKQISDCREILNKRGRVQTFVQLQRSGKLCKERGGGSLLDQACAFTARRILHDWPKLYSQLPFNPTRTPEQIRDDIRTLAGFERTNVVVRRDRSATEDAMTALSKWISFSRASADVEGLADALAASDWIKLAEEVRERWLKSEETSADEAKFEEVQQGKERDDELENAEEEEVQTQSDLENKFGEERHLEVPIEEEAPKEDNYHESEVEEPIAEDTNVESSSDSSSFCTTSRRNSVVNENDNRGYTDEYISKFNDTQKIGGEKSDEENEVHFETSTDRRGEVRKANTNMSSDSENSSAADENKISNREIKPVKTSKKRKNSKKINTKDVKTSPIKTSEKEETPVNSKNQVNHENDGDNRECNSKEPNDSTKVAARQETKVSLKEESSKEIQTEGISADQAYGDEFKEAPEEWKVTETNVDNESKTDEDTPNSLVAKGDKKRGARRDEKQKDASKTDNKKKPKKKQKQITKAKGKIDEEFVSNQGNSQDEVNKQEKDVSETRTDKEESVENNEAKVEKIGKTNRMSGAQDRAEAAVERTQAPANSKTEEPQLNSAVAQGDDEKKQKKSKEKVKKEKGRKK